jgi:hypothetical protein
MKRLALLTVLLLVLGLTMGFAIEVTPTVALSGSAVMKWGVDLDNSSTGFDNSGSGDIVVTLVASDGTDTHKGTGSIYGSITISDIELGWTDEVFVDDPPPHQPDIAGSLFIVPFEIGLFDAPGMTADVVSAVEDIANNAVFGFSDSGDTGYAAIDNVIDTEASLAPAYGGKGTFIKYADPSGAFWGAVDVKSADTISANTANAYALGGEAGVTFAPVALALGVFQGFGYTANPLAAYVSATLTLTGVGTIKAGVDVSMGATTDIELGGSAQINFNEAGTAYFLGKGIYDLNGNHTDVLAGLSIGAGSIMGPLNLNAAVYVLDLLQTLEPSAYATLGYKVDLGAPMYMNPTVTVAFGAPAGGANILNLAPALEIGLAAAPLAKVTIKYTSGDLMASPLGMGIAEVDFEVDY